jgi:hypothetical protein
MPNPRKPETVAIQCIHSLNSPVGGASRLTPPSKLQLSLPSPQSGPTLRAIL